MRLIDADALLEKDFRKRFYEPYDNTVFEVIIEDAPTVDIKTEVAREIFAEIEKDLSLLFAKYHRERKNLYDTYINTKLDAICVAQKAVAELKNKYTKEGKEI